MPGKSEKVTVEIAAGANGTNVVTIEYLPVTTESSDSDHQVALELAIAALAGKAIAIRRQLGQRVPVALLLAEESKTFMDFYR